MELEFHFGNDLFRTSFLLLKLLFLVTLQIAVYPGTSFLCIQCDDAAPWWWKAATQTITVRTSLRLRNPHHPPPPKQFVLTAIPGETGKGVAEAGQEREVRPGVIEDKILWREALTLILRGTLECSSWKQGTLTFLLHHPGVFKESLVWGWWEINPQALPAICAQPSGPSRPEGKGKCGLRKSHRSWGRGT